MINITLPYNESDVDDDYQYVFFIFHMRLTITDADYT